MAILTELDLAEVRALAAHFGKDVASFRGLLAGSVNSNFALETPAGERLFMRVYEEQTPSTAAREAELLEHLGRESVPTPKPLARIDGLGFIAETRGKPVALFPFLDGASLCQARVDARAAEAVGRALASIHLAGDRAAARLASLTGSSRFDRAALRARLASLPADVSGEVHEARRRLSALLAIDVQTPKVVGLIHGDLFRDNVLFETGSTRIAALLDFESASVGSIAFDLMVTVLAWCFGDRLETSLARAMLDGYATVRPIDHDLASELYDAAIFTCARFGTTRITDFELRPEGTGIYKDFRRFLRRLDAIEALGPTGLLGVLGLSGFAESGGRD